MADPVKPLEAREAPPSWPRRGWRIARLLIVFYLGVVLVLWLLENWLVYHPVSAAQDWKAPPSPDIRDVDLTAADGTKLHAWWLPCEGSNSALLYLHGNAGNLSWRGDAILKIQSELKVGVLIVDYPGYGKSEGRPSEQGCYQAGDAGYAWLTDVQKVPPDRVLLWGISLGGGIAVDLACRQECRALILLKTFTSAPDVGSAAFPWIPVRWIMRNRFANIDKIAACGRPVFITHGTTDEVVPYALGQRLFEAAREPKEFFVMDKLGHNDALSKEMFEALRGFLERHAP